MTELFNFLLLLKLKPSTIKLTGICCHNRSNRAGWNVPSRVAAWFRAWKCVLINIYFNFHETQNGNQQYYSLFCYQVYNTQLLEERFFSFYSNIIKNGSVLELSLDQFLNKSVGNLHLYSICLLSWVESPSWVYAYQNVIILYMNNRISL